MQEIGKIKQVQVQRSSLKAGQKPYRYYDPTPLLVVAQLRISTQGIVGLTADGDEIIDVHHANHPNSKNEEVNSISIGLTSHYASIRERYGNHLCDGCAGENILVEAEQVFTLLALGSQLAILSQTTGQLIYLSNLLVAAPCVEFSQFAANAGMPLVGEQLKAALQFLHEGRRGFYATLADNSEQDGAIVQAGDSVFVID